MIFSSLWKNLSLQADFAHLDFSCHRSPSSTSRAFSWTKRPVIRVFISFLKKPNKKFSRLILLTITPLGAVTHPLTFSETKLNMLSKHIKGRFEGACPSVSKRHFFGPEGKMGKMNLFWLGWH